MGTLYNPKCEGAVSICLGGDLSPARMVPTRIYKKKILKSCKYYRREKHEILVFRICLQETGREWWEKIKVL